MALAHPLSIGGIASEFGIGLPQRLGSTTMRQIAQVPSGSISINNFVGRAFSFHREAQSPVTLNQNVANQSGYPFSNIQGWDSALYLTTYTATGSQYYLGQIDLGSAVWCQGYQLNQAGSYNTAFVSGQACQYWVNVYDGSGGLLMSNTWTTTVPGNNIYTSQISVNQPARYFNIYAQHITDSGGSLYDGYFYLDNLQIMAQGV